MDLKTKTLVLATYFFIVRFLFQVELFSNWNQKNLFCFKDIMYFEHKTRLDHHDWCVFIKIFIIIRYLLYKWFILNKIALN